MMGDALPTNVYRVAQRQFDTIPGAPWVYLAPEGIRRLFEDLPSLRDLAQPRQGLATTNNFRFVRYWWEISLDRIAFGCRDETEARASGRCWFPYMKGGEYRKWYGNQEHVVDWGEDGAEIKESIVCRYPYLNGNWEWVAKNTDYYFREGVTWSKVTSGGFSIRYTPPGFVFDVAGTSVFPPDGKAFHTAGVLNTQLVAGILRLISPTLNYEVGHIASLPLKTNIAGNDVAQLASQSTLIQVQQAMSSEITFDFVAPPRWDTGLEDLTAAGSRLDELQKRIDDEIYEVYGISDADRAAIEVELAGGRLADQEDEEAVAEATMTHEELAVRWISYAVGMVLGRFQPGIPGALGSAVYRRADFAVGSLPEPGETEFAQLVGPVERFAYVDAGGGRHLFPAEIERELGELALPDGIAVFDEGHPRDLPTLLERALTLMLGEASTYEVITHGAGGGRSTALPSTKLRAGRGSLRKFLERDFFTKWHVKWYRKRPVYWPLQSARRNYGFVLFHEPVERSTLYVLQREYLDHKLNGLRLQIGDLRSGLEDKEGRARKQVEGQIDSLTQILDELTEFAGTMDILVREGYEPTSEWIDDGIILRLAPLWDLIPIWKSEPKKHWERLQRGDFDWSHIAIRYWPERVREKCKTDRSLAIAHGL